MPSSVDISGAVSALDFIVANTKRTLPQALNKMGLTFVIGAKGVKGAMQLTPKADKQRIKKDLDKNMGGSAGGEGAKVHKNQYGTFSARSSRRLGKGPKRLVTILAIQELRKKGQEANESSVRRQEEKIIRRRTSAVGYTANAGWSNAAQAFGGRGLKGVTASTKKESRHGEGKRATESAPRALLTNTAPAIEKIGIAATQKALENAVEDGLVYARRKIQEACNKVSA